MVIAPAPPPVARAVAAGAVQGSLTAPPTRPGALGIPIPGCQLSTGSPRSLVIDYAPGSLRIRGRARRVVQVTATLRFNTRAGDALGGTLRFSLRAGARQYRWSSVTGTVRVRDGSRAGWFHAWLRTSGGPGSMRLAGSWRRCQTVPTL